MKKLTEMHFKPASSPPTTDDDVLGLNTCDGFHIVRWDGYDYVDFLGNSYFIHAWTELPEFDEAQIDAFREGKPVCLTYQQEVADEP